MSRALTRRNRKGLVDAYKPKHRRLTGDGACGGLRRLPNRAVSANPANSQPLEAQQG